MCRIPWHLLDFHKERVNLSYSFMDIHHIHTSTNIVFPVNDTTLSRLSEDKTFYYLGRQL